MSRRDAATQLEFLGAVQPKVNGNVGAAPLVDAGTENHTLVLTAATTIGVPSTSGYTPVVGDKLYLVIIQDATAGRTLAWNAIFRNAPTGLGGTATAGQRASFEFRWDGVSWQYVGGSTVFA